MTQGLISFITLISTVFTNPSQIIKPVADNFLVGQVLGQKKEAEEENILASHSMDLSTRYEQSEFVNEVFADNILLALHYLAGREKSKDVDWSKIRKPFEISFILNPGEVFAFHNQVLPEYKDKVAVSTNSRFYADEGYKNSGYIYGDGVCHLASLMNWVATDAGLKVTAKVNHDFRKIPGIPGEYGTSIRYADSGSNTQNQNLYIENNQDFPVEFRFKVEGDRLDIRILGY